MASRETIIDSRPYGYGSNGRIGRRLELRCNAPHDARIDEHHMPRRRGCSVCNLILCRSLASGVQANVNDGADIAIDRPVDRGTFRLILSGLRRGHCSISIVGNGLPRIRRTDARRAARPSQGSYRTQGQTPTWPARLHRDVGRPGSRATLPRRVYEAAWCPDSLLGPFLVEGGMI